MSRKSERGFALILALVLAVLYFGFIELLMMDASRELSEARRFRGRIVALTLAENGVELAATKMLGPLKAANPPPETDWQGTMSGTLKKATEPDESGWLPFVLTGTARSKGREGTSAEVKLQGRINGNQIQILYSQHTQ